MCKNVSVNNFLNTSDNYLKLSTITHNDILFPSIRRHDGFFNFLKIMLNLARYSGLNICDVIKTGKFINLHCLLFQNLQTELTYIMIVARPILTGFRQNSQDCTQIMVRIHTI